MGTFVVIYLLIAGGVLGAWLTVCWTEQLKLNLFIATLCSALWAAALVYVTTRYALPWIAARLYRDACLVLVQPSSPKLKEADPRPPRETGIYD